ncbi:c-type cytochrome [Silvibacterium acidisoli]|uniref:c-type cytochrome n=1 Tax=Acidobacteriaceae bacterium ZG23-2 TaxID=2883246 RepID=UPI00406C095F
MMNVKKNFTFPTLLFAIGLGFGSPYAESRKQTLQANDQPAGKQLFLNFCAACHGTDGKGGAPATPELKQIVPDLTTLSQRYGGQYPSQYVRAVLRSGVKNIEDHGTSEMPVWGKEFKTIPGNDNIGSARRIDLLSRYLETLQTK